MSNEHEGHRKRMKQRFLTNGLAGFKDHEVLEMLLFYGIQRINTNEIAHRMINKYGSFSGVLNAPIAELLSFKGMTENAATLLKFVPNVLKFYNCENKNVQFSGDPNDMVEFFISEYIGVTEEEVKVCCLDTNMRAIVCETVAYGTVNSAPFNARKIIQFILNANSAAIILAHNHPGGLQTPSPSDIVVTRKLHQILSSIDIRFIDHIIISGAQGLSMKSIGVFDCFD